MLEQLDFSVPVDFGKNGLPADIYKSIAFQLGQVLALIEGIELYTKEDICSYYPPLAPALRRESITPECMQAIEDAKQYFLFNQLLITVNNHSWSKNYSNHSSDMSILVAPDGKKFIPNS